MPKARSTKTSQVSPPKAGASTSSTSTPSASDDYVFLISKQTSGWASQWYPSPFTLPWPLELPQPESTTSESEESNPQKLECTFPTAEHYMMFRKALLFNDTSIAHELISDPSYTTNTSPSTMAKVKALGRQVQNFDEDTWKQHRYQIVLDGNLAKFRQNSELRSKLFATGNRRHVEASPRDRIWGVGFGQARAAKRVNEISPPGTIPKEWGLNLLGKALDETRKILLQEEESGS